MLVVYGSFDQFEPRGTHALIVDIVNRARPGTAEIRGLQGADHDLVFYPRRDGRLCPRGRRASGPRHSSARDRLAAAGHGIAGGGRGAPPSPAAVARP